MHFNWYLDNSFLLNLYGRYFWYLELYNACTYQFYEHRGFKRACERNIILNIGKKKIPLKCFIFSKTIK